MIKLLSSTFLLPLGLLLGAPACQAGFELAGPAGSAHIVHEDDATMRLSAQLLQRDVRAVSGMLAAASTRMADCGRHCVVIGRHDSALVQNIAREEGIDLSALSGGWERYQRVVFSPRRDPERQVMLIAGSDTRGTVYGVIDLTREMGVSAWEWWADVQPAQRKRIELSSGALVSGSPSVQYRGVFLNDEDWGLQPWAARRDPAKDIGPATYARIFELLWRLKANIIWPAMHDSTKPFYQIPANAEMARDYAIVVGTSHAEPMMRNNVREWDRKDGPFNFFSNRDALVRYWDRRVKEVKQFENMYSVGIRGVHDSAMEGADTVRKQVEGVTDVMDVQRKLLSAAQGKPAAQIPQALTLYKEVLDIYKAGLKVSDDITLVWPDDNYGYMHQLSTPQEARRGGGAGLYYHLSYWGRPHDYLWLGTTHPALVRDQLERAATTGTSKLWIANVGDIKPLEYLTQYFLDIAFDQKQLALTPRQHLVRWLSQQFDAARAEEIADILLGYYDLAWERRPEFMGFSQTEPITATQQSAYMRSGGEEAEQRLDKYAALVRRAEAVYAALPAAQRDAYFQLVLYPVRASANLNSRVLKSDLAAELARAGRPAADLYARQAERAQRAIAEDTAKYNQGKWQGMMDAAPRRLPVFAPPLSAQYGKPLRRDCAVAYPAPLSGLSERLEFTSGRAESKTITLVNYGASKVRWNAAAVPDGYRLSPGSGELDSANGYEQRIQVHYDGKAGAGQVSLACGAAAVKARLSLAPGAEGRLPTEHERIVALPSASAKVAEGWTVLPGLGSYGASMRSDLLLASVNLDAVEARKPLEYVFVTHTQGAARLKFVTVPSHPLTSANGVRLAYSLDGGPLQLLDFETSGRSDEWKRNVLTNTAVRSRDVPNLVPGRHSLKVYALDPGVVLDRIEIAFDGAPNHYGKPLSASGDAQAWLASPAPAAGAGDAPMAFNFDVATAPDGRTTVRAGAAYDAQRGFGFENGTSAWNGQPWQFSVALKEGNYDVAITFGSAEAAARATVKAELRRLMVAPGDTSHQGSGPAVRRFTVNVRNPAIAARNGVAEGKVDLLPRETGGEGKAWDERLTLEIHAEAGAVRGIDISPATVPTIFLLGDSTVADQADEPFASWGQMLTRFFKPGIAVANHAESGESLRASLSRRRIDKVVSSLRPGDLVLIQFGHNDQKQLFDGSSAPFTTYKNELKTHVDMVRAAGGIPVLVTSVERRRFDGQGHISTTLNDYAEAVRQASRELGTPLIDLHAMSMRLYAAMGAEASASLFAAPPGKQVDNTHHNPYGAFVLARLVAQGLRDTGLPAARYLAADLGQVDPAHPILPGQFNVPPSPVKTSERPRGD